MNLQPCNEPTELKILNSLNPRITLSNKDKQQLFSLQKGYEGELMFEKDWLEKLPGECFIINDLLLEYGGNIFQIDSLVITQKNIYLFDVKNYEGDYYLDGGIWRKRSGAEIKDPIAQLKRCESFLRRLFQGLSINIPIEPFLIFINSEFTLYQAPLDMPLVFHSQLPRFMKNLNISASKLNMSHSKLADQLIARQLDEAKQARYPSYDYEQLHKEVTCGICRSFMVGSSVNNKLICSECGCLESIDSAIMRSVGEFQFLFPERKITTNGVYEWCGGIISKKGIRRILNKNFNLQGYGKYSYFTKDM
jgi:hypothetical protein